MPNRPSTAKCDLAQVEDEFEEAIVEDEFEAALVEHAQ
jgi:hypothetical protein